MRSTHFLCPGNVLRAPCAWRGLVARLVVAAGVALAFAPAALTGCGSALSLTGGSIPVGTSAVRGVVIHGDAAPSVVPGAVVTLQLDPSHLSVVRTDTAGAFSFQGIAAGRYMCSVYGPIGSGVAQTVQWPVEVAQGVTVQVVAAALPTSFDVRQVASILVTPATPTVRVGQQVRLAATAYDVQGRPLPVQPTLQVLDGLGQLAADGTFTASAPGMTKIEAWIDSIEGETWITVTP